jgi:predicted metal-dependent HD superfamily phosphohydrolase
MSGSLAHLESEWRKDTARFSSSDATEIFNDIVARHSESQRRYHGLSHLTALLDLLGKHATHLAPGSAPRLALWWHDAIYDPTVKDNEEQSAILARDHLARLGAPATLIEDVAAIILITKNHLEGGSAGEGDYFLDADIAILGAPPSVYDAYTVGVRQEYSWAPDDAFRAGRSAFLRKALTWPRLFRTDIFESTYAAQARANMERELAALIGPGL